MALRKDYLYVTSLFYAHINKKIYTFFLFYAYKNMYILWKVI